MKEIITAHRAWLRNERGGRRADLSLKVLRDLNLKGLNLPKAKLTGIQLINCDLSGANLRESDLFAANLAGSRFIGADCRDCDFRGAALQGADFSEAKLSGTDFREGSLLVSSGGSVEPPKRETWKSDKTDTAMNRADLTGAKLRNSIVRKADFSGAVLRNADLSGANFNGSTLKDVDLRGANLANCDLSGTQLNRAVVEGAFLDGVVLTDANVHGVNLNNAIYNSLDTSVTISVDDSAETQALIGEMIVAHESWVTSSGARRPARGFLQRRSLGPRFLRPQPARRPVRRFAPALGQVPSRDRGSGGFLPLRPDRRQFRRRLAARRQLHRRHAAAHRLQQVRPRDRDRGAGRRQDARMAAALQRLQARGNQFQGREGDSHHRDQCGHRRRSSPTTLS